jgi:hypothetical protein
LHTEQNQVETTGLKDNTRIETQNVQKKTKCTINSPSITGLWHQAPSKNYSNKKRLQPKLEMTGKNNKKGGQKKRSTPETT